MRIATLTATLVALVLAAPAAAQTSTKPAPQKAVAQKPATHRSESPAIFVAVLSGAYEVPEVETRATGTTELTLVGSRLHYQVHVDSISDITGAYLHIGRAGAEAPAVADLFDGVKAGPTSGILASGTLHMAALHETTMRRLLRALREDDVYVTVHTLAHPGGELRGQLRIQRTVATR